MTDFVVSENIRSFGDIIVGAIPASTGAIRLENAGDIVVRNQNDNGDFNVISFDASANMIIGDLGMPFISFVSGQFNFVGSILVTEDANDAFKVETDGSASVFNVDTIGLLVTLGAGVDLTITGNLIGGLQLGTLEAANQTAEALPEEFSVAQGNIEVLNPATLDVSVLTDGAFPDSTNWAGAGEWSDVISGNTTFTFASTGNGTLTQTAAQRVTGNEGSNNRWYKAVYTLTSVTNSGSMLLTITNAFTVAGVDLPVTANGTFTVYFQSNPTTANSGDFVLDVTGATAGDTFTMDNLSVREVTGGDVIIGGQLTGGGPLGLRIDGAGSAFLTGPSIAIGTTPATTGEIRLPVNASISMRNAANDADISLLSMIATDIIEHGDDTILQQNIFGRVAIQPRAAADGSLTVNTGTGTAQGFTVTGVGGAFFSVDTTSGSEVVSIFTPGGLRLAGDAGVGGLSIRTLTQVKANSGVLASGSTFTFTDAIPAGARLISVTARVGQVLVGPTSWDLGISGGDIDRWGATLGLSGGTQVGVADYTNTGVFEQDLFPTATSILVTANGPDFTAGTIGIVVTYETISPPIN